MTGKHGATVLRTVWRPTRFAEFWPVYLAEHGDGLTVRLHIAGTVAGCLLLAASVLGGPALFAVGMMVAYLLAWIVHFQTGTGRPASFGHPLWSLMADLKMTSLYLTGRLGAERRRLGAAGIVPADQRNRSGIDRFSTGRGG